MSQLMKACYNYSVTKVPGDGRFPEHASGSTGLLWLYASNEVTDWRVFNCPVKGGGGPGTTSYRCSVTRENPNGTVNQAPLDAMLIADGADDHGTSEIDVPMNYAVCPGSVHSCPHNSPMWTTTIPLCVGH